MTKIFVEIILAFFAFRGYVLGYKYAKEQNICYTILYSASFIFTGLLMTATAIR